MFKDKTLNIMLSNARKDFKDSTKSKDLFFKRVRRGKISIVKTGFHKNYLICFNFKKNFKFKRKIDKIDELKRLSLVSVENRTPYIKRRSKKRYGNNKICWVCNINEATCQHHIIMLKNGGYDNGINRIPICNECHSEIHTWI